MDRDDRVLSIVLAAEHLLRLAGIHLGGEILERLAQVLGDRLAGLRPLDEHGEILAALAQRFAQIAVFLDPAAALQQLLRRGLILPEIGSGDPLLYFLEFVRRSGGVKDSSAGRWRGAPSPRTCEAVHPAGKPNGETPVTKASPGGIAGLAILAACAASPEARPR